MLNYNYPVGDSLLVVLSGLTAKYKGAFSVVASLVTELPSKWHYDVPHIQVP